MATTPMPDEGVGGEKISVSTLQGQTLPTSPTFWGRKAVPGVPTVMEIRGLSNYPRMMYAPDPERRAKLGQKICQAAETEEQHAAALENGWLEEPTLVHLEMLQMGDNGRSGKRLAINDDSQEVPAIQEMEPEFVSKGKKSK